MKEILKENNYDYRSFNQLAYILARDILNSQQWSKNLDNLYWFFVWNNVSSTVVLVMYENSSQ